jgi:hypothetical protein
LRVAPSTTQGKGATESTLPGHGEFSVADLRDDSQPAIGRGNRSVIPTFTMGSGLCLQVFLIDADTQDVELVTQDEPNGFKFNP